MYGQTFTSTHRHGSLIEHCKGMVTMVNQPDTIQCLHDCETQINIKDALQDAIHFVGEEFSPCIYSDGLRFLGGIISTMYIWMHLFSGRKWEDFHTMMRWLWSSCFSTFL